MLVGREAGEGAPGRMRRTRGTKKNEAVEKCKSIFCIRHGVPFALINAADKSQVLPC